MKVATKIVPNERTEHEVNGRKLTIEVAFVNPPIPTRKFDFEAVTADYDYGDPIGYGPTAEAARNDLLELLTE